MNNGESLPHVKQYNNHIPTGIRVSAAILGGFLLFTFFVLNSPDPYSAIGLIFVAPLVGVIISVISIVNFILYFKKAIYKKIYLLLNALLLTMGLLLIGSPYIVFLIM